MPDLSTDHERMIAALRRNGAVIDRKAAAVRRHVDTHLDATKPPTFEASGVSSEGSS